MNRIVYYDKETCKYLNQDEYEKLVIERAEKIKNTNDNYINKRLDMDLVFVMSYIKGDDNGWMEDYNRIAKTVFKEENK